MRLPICWLLLATCSFAQNARHKSESQAGYLVALERMWNQAQMTQDSRALRTLIADEFINTEWDGQVSDKDTFLAEIAKPRFTTERMSIQDVKVNLYDNTAVVTGTYHTNGSYRGKPYYHLGRFTDTWVLDHGKWQCVASHTSLIKTD
jgi:Domain of unknown function (DUF4440)